ncbi:MAG TPA: winged helix-turn-helix domain-containing protein [Tepidisphaeraceae bacterium]|nr:winged helix-turn-helix domain-containing protein [Tepidisphaeraceae bacterium]
MEGSAADHTVGSRKRFGVFEFDPAARELTKHGVRLKVQEQPIQILALLLEHAGQIVPREDLQRRLWPDGTFVDYEQSLNKAVNKLRQALGDSANHPIYIETLARRGYRFLPPIEGAQVAKPPAGAGPPRRRAVRWPAAGGFALALVLATGLWPLDVPQVESVTPLTNDTTFKVGGFGRLISNGNRVLYGDDYSAWSVPVSGGESKRLSLPYLKGARSIVLSDASPSRQQILVALPPSSKKSDEVELWLSGEEGEAPHKVAEVKPLFFAALAPDAERIALQMPDGIYIQSIQTGVRRRIHQMIRATPTLPWWHPSGHIVGFLEPSGSQQKSQAWQVNDDGTHLRRVVPETERGQCSGGWSQDGKRFFYLGCDGEVYLRIQAGILGWLRKPVVSRLTASGQFRTQLAVDPANPKRLYAVGSVLRGETMRYDRKARRWVSFLGGFSGEKIDRSPDGQWLAYITYPRAELHKCRADGSGDVLLAAGVEGMNPSWSPDGKQIAFSGRPAGTSVKFKLWLVSPEGNAAPYPPGIDSGTDTIWSRDGKRILLGKDDSTQSRIRVLHVETGELESITDTEKLFSPRWSPDEKQILAMEVNTAKLRILDAAKGEWRPLTEYGVGYPKWSRDGKYIYGVDVSRSAAEALRIEVATGAREEIARADFRMIENSNWWLGWTDNWEPLVVRDLSSTQVYRIDMDR